MVNTQHADETATLGRRAVWDLVIDAGRRCFSGASCWCLLVDDFHRFIRAISGVVLNEVGKVGRALDPVVWSIGGPTQKSRTNVLNRDRASMVAMVGHADLAGSWYGMDQVMLSQEDLATWACSPGILAKFSGSSLAGRRSRGECCWNFICGADYSS